MYITTINGKEVKTNYGQDYRTVKGFHKNGYVMKEMKWVLPEGSKYRCLEGEKAMLERLVNEGYRTIQFVKSTTSVRGYYNVWAYAKVSF